MKIKPEHLARLKEHVAVYNTPNNRRMYAKRDPSIFRIEHAQNLDRRFRWDCLWGDMHKNTKLEGSDDPKYIANRVNLVNEMYEYMNDEHIDTALRSLIKPLVFAHG